MQNIKKVSKQQDTLQDDSLNVLAYLFRKVCLELNVGVPAWNRLMNKYVNDPDIFKLEGLESVDSSRDSKRRSSLRSNLEDGLMKSNMTPMNFIRGIRFLRPFKVLLRVRIEIKEKGYESVRELKIREVGFKIDKVLADMFKTIYQEVAPTPERHEVLLNLFLDDPVNGISQDPGKRTSAKSNIRRTLVAGTMTWKNFQRCLFFLRPKRIIVGLDVTWPVTKKVTKHTVSFKPGFSIKE